MYRRRGGTVFTGSGCDPPRETDYEPGLWSQPERHLGARHTYNLNLNAARLPGFIEEPRGRNRGANCCCHVAAERGF